MINDGDRHGYKTRSSTGCILYTVIITTWMINDEIDMDTKLDQVQAVYYIL